MYLAKVIGKVVSVIKHPAYENRTLLLVQPLSVRSELVRTPTIAVDYVGGGGRRYGPRRRRPRCRTRGVRHRERTHPRTHYGNC